MNPYLLHVTFLAILVSVALTGRAAAETDAELLKDLDALKQDIEGVIQGTDELPALERSEDAPPPTALQQDGYGLTKQAEAVPAAVKPILPADLKPVSSFRKTFEITPESVLPGLASENGGVSAEPLVIEPISVDKSADLCRAARRGDAARVKKLLGLGADPNARLKDGTTALGEAAGAGYSEVVKVLIASGANVNAKGFVGGTPLISAAAAGHRDVVALLLSSGADPRAKTGAGLTALNRAEKKGFEEVAALLRKANPA